MYFITDNIILLYHHYGCNLLWKPLVADILVWATPKLWLEDWGGGANLWVLWVGSVDIEWKYYQRNSLQISNLQSFQLPRIGNDILSCKIKSKGSGWIKGLYSERSVQLYTWKQMLTSGNAWGAVYYNRLILLKSFPKLSQHVLLIFYHSQSQAKWFPLP